MIASVIPGLSRHPPPLWADINHQGQIGAGFVVHANAETSGLGETQSRVFVILLPTVTACVSMGAGDCLLEEHPRHFRTKARVCCRSRRLGCKAHVQCACICEEHHSQTRCKPGRCYDESAASHGVCRRSIKGGYPLLQKGKPSCLERGEHWRSKTFRWLR